MTKASAEVVAEYQEILKKNGITDTIKEVILKAPDFVNENWGSRVEYITINFENPNTPALDLFAKKLFEDAAQAAFLVEMGVFKKEAAIYNYLSKDMRSFYKSKTGSEAEAALDFIPKCYHADDKKIILQNMVKQGYVLLSKHERQDFETARIVLRNLAIYHAISYAMIAENGRDAFNAKYEAFLDEILLNASAPASWQESFNTGVKNCIQFFKKAEHLPDQSNLIKKLSEYMDGKAFQDVVQARESAPLFEVVNHGDCWNNNMLFHLNESGRPDRQLLVDYQVGRIGSPSMDLAQYLYTSVKPEVRNKQLKELLSFYFETFKHVLTQELNVPFTHTFEDFHEDFIRKSPIGFWIFISMNLYYNIIGEIGIGIEPWMEQNPEKVQKIANDIVDTIRYHFAQFK